MVNLLEWRDVYWELGELAHYGTTIATSLHSASFCLGVQMTPQMTVAMSRNANIKMLPCSLLVPEKGDREFLGLGFWHRVINMSHYIGVRK